MRSPTSTFAVVVLVVLPALWWWPLLAGWLPDFMDTVSQIYPYRLAAADQLHEGVIPLWNPYQAGGMPLAANPQVGVWYPPNWLFFAWPTPQSNGLVLLLHYWIGGLGLWMLSRATGARGWAALFAAVAFQFGSMMISRIALTPHLFTMAWLPWILWGIERAVRGRPAQGAAIVGCLYALQILAGAPQVSFYTALLLPGWWLCRAWALRRPVAATVRYGVVAATIALLLSAVQLLPTLEFLRESARSSISIERLTGDGLRDGFIWRALVGFTGNPIEDTDSINAIGAGLLLLLPLALVGRRRRRLTVPLLLFGGLFWVLALGILAPLLVRILPLYPSFHAPRRALLIWSVLGPLAAGHGAQVLLALLRKTPVRAIAPWCLLLLLGGNLWMLPRLEREFTLPDRFDPHPDDLAVLGGDRFITVDPTFRYAHGSRDVNYGLSLMPNLGSWHRLYDAQVYDPLILRRVAMLRDAACGRSGLFYPSHGVILSDPGSAALRMLNVRYLVGRWDAYAPSVHIPNASIDYQALSESLELVRPHPRWPLWRFKEPRPLAWIVDTVAPAIDARDALGLALGQGPYRIAFTEEPIYLRRSAPSPAVTAEHRPDATINVTLAEPASEDMFLCVASAWMPGWVARTDRGERVGGIPADGTILGVIVPAGTSSLVLSYEPTSFRQGWLLTLAGLLLTVVLCLYRPRKVDSTA